MVVFEKSKRVEGEVGKECGVRERTSDVEEQYQESIGEGIK